MHCQFTLPLLTYRLQSLYPGDLSKSGRYLTPQVQEMLDGIRRVRLRLGSVRAPGGRGSTHTMGRGQGGSPAEPAPAVGGGSPAQRRRTRLDHRERPAHPSVHPLSTSILPTHRRRASGPTDTALAPALITSANRAMTISTHTLSPGVFECLLG
jgi:hypothetical protein